MKLPTNNSNEKGNKTNKVSRLEFEVYYETFFRTIFLEFVFTTFRRFRSLSSGDIWSQIHSYNVLFRSNELVCNYRNNNKYFELTV